MTFVYAKKHQDLIYFLADSFTEVPKTKSKSNWFKDAICKIVIVNPDLIVAFAGSSNTALLAIREIQQATTSEPLELLLSYHRRHDVEAYEYVEFAACVLSDFELSFIKNGRIIATPASYLGQKAAMENFQRRMAGETTDSPMLISLVNQVDGVSEKSNQEFSNCLRAFQLTLMDSHRDFGGFAVPFIVRKNKFFYGTYTQTVRAPLSINLENLDIESKSVVGFSDKFRGGYQIIFSGTEKGFSAFLPFGSSGLLFRSFDPKEGFELEYLKDHDGYDFTHAASLAGVPPAWITWESDLNSLRKAAQLISIQQIARAAELVAKVEHRLRILFGNNPSGTAVDLSTSLIRPLSEVGEVRLTISAFNTIALFLELKRQLAACAGDSKAEQRWASERAFWLQAMEDNAFPVTIGTQSVDKRLNSDEN